MVKAVSFNTKCWGRRDFCAGNSRVENNDNNAGAVRVWLRQGASGRMFRSVKIVNRMLMSQETGETVMICRTLR